MPDGLTLYILSAILIGLVSEFAVAIHVLVNFTVCGWWYKQCTNTGLNGIFAGSRKQGNKYFFWNHLDTYSLKSAEMKVRRK